LPTALEGIELPLEIPKRLFSTLQLVLFLGGKNLPKMRWTNKKKGNICRRVLKIRTGFAT